MLNDSGTDFIYCAGGSESATSTTTGRVFRYDPIADIITTVAGGDWPPGANGTLPGGFTVFNNKLFILGGFDIPNGVRDQPDLGVYSQSRCVGAEEYRSTSSARLHTDCRHRQLNLHRWRR